MLVASVHAVDAHLHRGLETYHANATLPDASWDRVILTLHSWPDQDPWDRTFHVGLGPATVLHGTTPRTDFTTRRDVTQYLGLAHNGTLDVWTRLESYVGHGIVLDVTLDFYDDPAFALPQADVRAVRGVADLDGAGTYAWANVTFPSHPPNEAVLELFTSGHTADGEF